MYKLCMNLGLRNKPTHNSSIRSNLMEYRESEVDEDLAYKYYKKKLGVMDAADLNNDSDDYQDSDPEEEQLVRLILDFRIFKELYEI